jgi:hypothetical protein
MAKGQSALEYMMTYGWAILIIVIVAVILYSMGIFNPRASVTASSSGFSPFAVSAAVCGSNGVLSVAFTTGGLPNGATSAKITGMTLSSPSGLGSVSTTNTSALPSAVASGSTFVANFSGATCTSGTSFSASGNLSYSVSTAAGKATYSATGTIAGTAS